jgi:hypothetical protein
MALLQTWMRYYALDSYGVPTLDENTQDYLISVNCRKSKGGKSNTLDITLNNPIISFFSDGTPRRKFVDTAGSITFKAAKKASGYYNFEERLEIYAAYTDDTANTIVSDSNLIFSGQILSVRVVHANAECKIVLTCSDRTFNILNRIYSKSFQAVTSPYIIQQVVRRVTQNTDSTIIKYNANGVLGQGPGYLYTIDARLFSEGLKGSTDAVNASSTKTITVPTATFVTDGVEVGDMVRNTSTNQVALVVSVVSETSLIISKTIFTSAASMQVSNGFLQDFRPDGSVFPGISFGLARKPAYEWVEKLCEVEYTNTANEVELAIVVPKPLEFYVDGRNRLHVFYPDNTESSTFVVSQSAPVSPDLITHKVYNHDMELSLFDIINFVQFKCGQDMNNQQIVWYAQDPTSGGPIVKDSYRPFLHIARQMKIEDNLVNNGNDEYAYPSSYPGSYIPKWDRQSRVVTSNSEYNTNFKEEARLRGEAAAFQIINKTANPRWKGSISIRGENQNVSNLISFTDREIGITQIKVRLTDLVHTINRGGWFTRLEVKEDVPETE